MVTHAFVWMLTSVEGPCPCPFSMIICVFHVFSLLQQFYKPITKVSWPVYEVKVREKFSSFSMRQ